MELRDYKTEISADLLRIMQKSGVTWWLLYRKDATLDEVQAYAWGNTIVFHVYDSIFLLAMTSGSYVDQQVMRYMTGMFVGSRVDDMGDLDEMVMAAADRWLL